ncbi:toll/interleukin-1 receptor domain-containing protein [Nemorincola caseinilytica]|uniref:Toll/interleukin-1 receptor domain-containing protein n=1 Tax=Nemorincola caseinilytica TaxID=2054315 RepID=A0ABP8NID3_9BACT
MHKVFLSHSSKQKYLVEVIAEKLGRDRAIYDNYTFELGVDTLDDIFNSLNKTDLFVFFISNESLESTWVKTELNQANKIALLNSSKQFLPIIIDSSIDHNDLRIPLWLRQKTIRKLQEPFLIIKKIEQSLRDILLDSNPILKAKDDLFVGRNHLMEEFENQILTISGQKPNAFISSGVEGVGRRTFMKKALFKTNLIKENYEPISIHLDEKESIEDFILKVEDANGNLSDRILENLESMTFEDRIKYAVNLIYKISESSERLFIIDTGCIIMPNKAIANWFIRITDDEMLSNYLGIILITRFRPNPSFIVKNKRIQAIHIEPLSEKDIQKLYVKYCHISQLSIPTIDSEKILKALNGIPSQVFFAVDLIKRSTIEYATKNINEIIEFGEAKIFYIITEIKKKQEYLDVLTLLSNVGVMSFDLLYKVIGRNSETEKILEYFYVLGIYDTVGGFADYIRVNYSISDYVKRSKFEINATYKRRLKKQLEVFLAETKEHYDVSELLINVKNALINNYKVPDKYLLPSFVLKSIVDMYYQRMFGKVVALADKILERKSNMDNSMIMDIRYWLCSALAREKNPRFESEVLHISGPNHDFLYGFYYRRKKDLDSALYYLNKTLKVSRNHNRAKRELVNVLLSKGAFEDALDIARDNYKNSKTNAFHIQAYFLCLIKKNNHPESDIKILERLMDDILKTNSKQAEEIHNTMQGEFEFYINQDASKAIQVLKDALYKNKNKYYAYRSLYLIYNKQGKYQVADELKSKYENDNSVIDELEELE